MNTRPDVLDLLEKIPKLLPGTEAGNLQLIPSHSIDYAVLLLLCIVHG
jgi:hypothetical protein